MSVRRIPLNQPNKEYAFKGRESELKDLLSFIADRDGGTILVSGTRGTGKTKLVRQLEERFVEARTPRTFFIDIVLHDDIDAEDLRYVILRSICYSLIEVEYKLKWWKPNDISLFKKYFWPWLRNDFMRNPRFGRRRDYRQLIRFANYTKATEKISAEMNADIKNKSLALGRKASVGLDGELDLSNSRLEQLLRRYLESVARLGVKVVFVFDELDKFENRDFSALDIAKKFKNLLTKNGTFAIFITSERELRLLHEDALANPHSIHSTLFSKTVMLNQISPRLFRKIAESRLHGFNSGSDFFKDIRDYLLWESDLHLFSLERVIDEHKVFIKGSAYFEPPTETVIEQRAALQNFLVAIYDEHAFLRDGFHNRLLYRVLKTAGELLLSSTSLKFPIRSGWVPTNLVSVLLQPYDFVDDDQKKAFKKIATSGNPSAFALVDDKSWASELSMLKSRELQDVIEGLEKFFMYLDRAGVLHTYESPTKTVANVVFNIYASGNLQQMRRAVVIDEGAMIKEEEALKKRYEKLNRLAKKNGFSEMDFIDLLETHKLPVGLVFGLVFRVDKYEPLFSWEIEVCNKIFDVVEKDIVSN